MRQQWGEQSGKRTEEERRSEKKKSQKNEDAGERVKKRKEEREKKGCGAIWPDERWKSARRCGANHIPKSKR
jgi:hypothetical protein